MGNLINFGEKRKTSLRGKAERMIGFIVDNFYSPPMLVFMDQQGLDTSEEEVQKAKDKTRENFIKRYVEGKSTKEFSGVISQLKVHLKEIRDRNNALKYQQLLGVNENEIFGINKTESEPGSPENLA